MLVCVFSGLFLIVKLIFNNQQYQQIFSLFSLNFTQYLNKQMYEIILSLFYLISMIFFILQDAFLMHLIRLIVKD